MKNIEFHPADYDGHGHLRLPFLFWLVLLLQARTWVLFVIAGSSREQGTALLNLFYPDHAFMAGIATAIDCCAGGAALLAARSLVQWRSCQWRGSGAGGGGYRGAFVAIDQPTDARLFYSGERITELFGEAGLQVTLIINERK